MFPGDIQYDIICACIEMIFVELGSRATAERRFAAMADKAKSQQPKLFPHVVWADKVARN